MNPSYNSPSYTLRVGLILFALAFAQPVVCQAQSGMSGRTWTGESVQVTVSHPAPIQQPAAPHGAQPGWGGAGGGYYAGGSYGAGSSPMIYPWPAGGSYTYSPWNRGIGGPQYGDQTLPPEQRIGPLDGYANGYRNPDPIGAQVYSYTQPSYGSIPDAESSSRGPVSITFTPRRFIGGSGRYRHHGYDGYYYGNYGAGGAGADTYPSAYCGYSGFPGSIYASAGNVVVYSPPAGSAYVGSYMPFSPMDYVNSQIAGLYDYYNLAIRENPLPAEGRADIPQYAPAPPQYQEPEPAQPPVEEPQGPSSQSSAPSVDQAQPAYAAGSYKEAFADIQDAWNSGDIEPIEKHLKAGDSKIAISLGNKYSYSIASSDWADITRDAFDHLDTVSFQFTVLRFQKNGDITGYATHVYTGKDGQQETMYVSYTLRHRNGQWYVVAVDTSRTPIVPAQAQKNPADTPSGDSDDSSPVSASATDSGPAPTGDQVITNE